VVYANIFVALCALAQTWLTQVLFGILPNYDSLSYLLFVMLSTYVQYNTQRGYIINQSNVGSTRAQWVTRHRKVLLISNAVCLVVLLFLCNSLSWTAIGIMVGAEVIATMYYMPPFNLRRFGYVKPFIIGAVWTISCGLVPLLENKLLNGADAWLYLAAQFAFLSAVCMLFDVKDAEGDYMVGINTYANRFGLWTSKGIAIALFIAAAALILFTSMNGVLQFTNAGVMFTGVVLTLFAGNQKHSFFYYLLVDGLLLLQGLMLCAVALIK